MGLLNIGDQGCCTSIRLAHSEFATQSVARHDLFHSGRHPNLTNRQAECVVYKIGVPHVGLWPTAVSLLLHYSPSIAWYSSDFVSADCNHRYYTLYRSAITLLLYIVYQCNIDDSTYKVSYSCKNQSFYYCSAKLVQKKNLTLFYTKSCKRKHWAQLGLSCECETYTNKTIIHWHRPISTYRAQSEYRPKMLKQYLTNKTRRTIFASVTTTN